ncbi:MAG: RluA family pseudouridine synthase [Kiritimatiellae bacterium]|nr:RluA family pseudouridine synthase [Kiritimatiellia bacterium]
MRGAEILFEDADIIVVDKPAGMYVHRSPGHEEGTLAEELAATRPGMLRSGSPERPGVVHRLDADTSGVMVFAKTPRAYASLRKAFESHSGVEKVYLAVCHGAISPAEGTLETRMGRKPWDPKRMAAEVPGGKLAVTHWTVLAKKGPLALVEFRIETGRMHQIRVHAAHLGHPVAGDPLYGNAQKDAGLRVRPSRTLLHAVELSFNHPATGERMTFAAHPPPEITYAV